MNRLIKTLLLLFVVAGFSMTACKKDSDSKSNEEKLTGASCWKQSKVEAQDPFTGSWVEDTIDDCDKDDCITFNEDKTLDFDEGAVKCDPSDPQTATGTWSLSADGTTLTLNDPNSGSFTGTVTELTDSKLVLEIDVLGFKSRITFTN
ncbi:MAG: lipocalin family protein [Saprospiraceae bacterium]|nr:lipocalin family protein [Saprospiraceae bacterium]MCB0544359.1 lipocalin family protein [Saprospiraceae bacterium]MCB0576658.1 lipocalin family protein [Saprospiraceae bacterium]MCB9307320.1 lipocalin family protein [Lewinellaceae bacterium]MCB9355204.1 lipocalin family protein [Lewinellaceae bacterium]